MEALDLEQLTEADVARLLSVDRRTVRRMYKTHGLPATGSGKARRFVWALVLPWYLAYRVDTAGKGGKQAGTLDFQILQLRKSAAARAVEQERAMLEVRRQRARSREVRLRAAREARATTRRTR